MEGFKKVLLMVFLIPPSIVVIIWAIIYLQNLTI